MNFALNMKQALDSKGWTPAHLAAAMHDQGASICYSTISSWLSGRNEPRASVIFNIARALGCSPADLLGPSAGVPADV